jgi:hypothetical protein
VIVIQYEDARSARRAGGRGDQISSEELFADEARILDKLAHALNRDLSIRHPAIEVSHERLLVSDGQHAGVLDPRGHVLVQIAIIGRVVSRKGYDIGKPLLHFLRISGSR